ncbi:hypothetical protein AB0P19_06915 [Microbacterium oleivorans]|uniref:hypothetical protein n=1 Tax=Microbacterium oleivorans TaxID=273677 RepID=UPI0033F15682
MTDRKYPIVKKVSLAGLGEQWDDECYAYVVPATYQDQKDIAEKDFTGLSDAEQIDYQLSFVRARFVAGKIRVFNGSEFELEDMQPEHAEGSVELNDHLYAAIMGFDLDPKDIRKVATESALQTSDVKPTETTSSETSLAE